MGKARDLISILCFEYQREETIQAAKRLLLLEKAILPADRRSLFVRSECGDIGCGAVTALLVREGSSIVWRGFGYENNYEEGVQVEDYKQVGPYAFEVAQYERTLLHGIESLKAKPS